MCYCTPGNKEITCNKPGCRKKLSLNVVSLADVSTSSRTRSTEHALNTSLHNVADKRGGFAGNKIIIIALDQDDSIDKYDVHYERANLNHAETVALLERLKAEIARDMLPKQD